MKLTAEQMRSLPCFFSQIPDPRRTQGRRHRLSTVLGIAAGGVLCGMRGYKAIADWAQSLGQKSREDRKSTRLNSSHSQISYAVFCLKKKIRALHGRFHTSITHAYRI